MKKSILVSLLVSVTLGSLIALAFLAASSNLTNADSNALWGPRAGLPAIKVVSDSYAPSQEEKYNCHDQDFVLRVSNDYLHPFNPVFSDQTYTRCAFYTAFGLLSTSGLMQLNGAIQPYHISANISLLDVPNEKPLFVGYNTGLAAYDNPLKIFSVVPGSDTIPTTYKNEYKLNNIGEIRVLKDSQDNTILQLTNTKPSANAKWFVAQRYGQIVRVESDNFKVLAFPGDPELYGQVQNDALAITNDGRYVVATGNNRPSFKLYDLSTCQPDPSYNLNNATGCGEVDLLSYLQQQLGKQIIQINYPHFSNDGQQLSLNVVVEDGGVRKNELIALVAPGATYNQPVFTSSNYIALGDSFASGEGAFNYYDGTDESDNKCHLSKQSYPYLLGLKLQLDSVHSVACSGAKMVNINGVAPAASQYTIRPADAFSDYWLPGYSPQLDFIEQKQPDIVTISMVGNDVGFSSIVTDCIVFPGTCYSSYQDRKGLALNIDSKFNSLVAMYAQIKAAAAPDARVYVVGYPQIVQPDGNCGVNVRLNKSETEFAEKLIDYLDSVIKQAAAKAGVNYINTEFAFDGHQLCSSDPTAVNGLTAGNDEALFVGHESYHPTAVGHQLLAGAIAAQTNDFEKPDPAPDWSIKQPSPDDAVDFLGTPPSDQQAPVREIEFDQSASQQPVLRGGQAQSTLPALDFHLDPGTNYQIVLHSTPVQLGTFTTDGQGNLSYSVTIPADIAPGWHTIDVYGDDITGQTVDIQRLIYVAVSANDWDGNGIPNSQEPCGLFSASGIDADQDGIDDACDGVIGEPPTKASQNAPVTQPSANSVALNPIPIDAVTAQIVPAYSGAAEPNTDLQSASQKGPQVLGAATQKGKIYSENDATTELNPEKSNSYFEWLIGAFVLALLAVALIYRLKRPKQP